MTETDSNEDSSKFDKLLAELEKETLSEEPKPIIDKQIQKAKDEKKSYDEYVDVDEEKAEEALLEGDYFD